jgi:hypothetical protein
VWHTWNLDQFSKLDRILELFVSVVHLESDQFSKLDRVWNFFVSLVHFESDPFSKPDRVWNCLDWVQNWFELRQIDFTLLHLQHQLHDKQTPTGGQLCKNNCSIGMNRKGTGIDYMENNA